jgi:cation diffusion facilitator CzcD-associated flavoprotein CzcO
MFTHSYKDNTYPGCGSDIPGHWYSLSRMLNPHWSTYYPGQREIRAYSDAVWAQHGLQAHTRFGTEVVRATWDAQSHSYTVVLEDVVSRARRTVTARVVISAAGGFMSPRLPEDLLGIETFQGDKWHSAEWRHDVPLAGKRVGVIGNGCSAYVIIVLASLRRVPYSIRTRPRLSSCFWWGG